MWGCLWFKWQRLNATHAELEETIAWHKRSASALDGVGPGLESVTDSGRNMCPELHYKSQRDLRSKDRRQKKKEKKKSCRFFFYLYKFSSFFSPQTGHTDVDGRAISMALFLVLNISVAGTSEPSGVRYKKKQTNPKTLTQTLIFKWDTDCFFLFFFLIWDSQIAPESNSRCWHQIVLGEKNEKMSRTKGISFSVKTIFICKNSHLKMRSH